MPAHFTDIPYPVADAEAANKKYVDDQTGGGGGGGGGGGFRGVNHQTGRHYAVDIVSDKEKLITLNNALSVSVVLPSSGTGVSLVGGYDIDPDSYVFVNLYSGATIGIGESINYTGSGANLYQASFFLKKIGSPTGNAVAKLYAHSGTFGTSSVPGTLLATSDNVAVSTIPTAGQKILFTFSTPYTLALSNYVLTIEYSSGDASNYIRAAKDNTFLNEPGNEIELVGGTWTPNASADLIFNYYISTPPVIDDKWLAYFENIGAGLVTITTIDSSIDGISNIKLARDTGIIIASDGSSYYSCRGVGLGTEKLPTTIRVSGSDFTTSSTSLVDITGLTFAVLANAIYEVDIMLAGQATGTNGMFVNLNFSAAGATGSFITVGPTTSTTTPTLASNVIGTAEASAYWQFAATDSIVKASGVLKTAGTAGNITVQVKKNVSGSVTFYIGSRMSVTRMA